VNGDAGAGNGFGDGIADSTGRVVVLNGDHAAGGRTASGNQAFAIDRRD
jgi:hypothetical protein